MNKEERVKCRKIIDDRADAWINSPEESTKPQVNLENIFPKDVMERAKMAKYRDANNPHAWYLTEFTMEQVERRIAYLEKENTALRKEIEKGRLIRNCARLLLKKLSLNDYGSDRECRQAYKELNAAFEELEEYEKEVGQ